MVWPFCELWACGGMVDAADLKSVVRMDVPVRVRPSPPF